MFIYYVINVDINRCRILMRMLSCVYICIYVCIIHKIQCIIIEIIFASILKRSNNRISIYIFFYIF